MSGFIYDEITGPANDRYCSPYSEGYIVVKANKKFGIMDRNGKLVVDTVFDGITNLHEGQFLVIFEGNVGIAKVK